MRSNRKHIIVSHAHQKPNTIALHGTNRQTTRDGNGAGRGQRMGSLPPPCMDFSCPIPVPPCMTGKIFYPIPAPSKTHEAPPYLVKLYFLSVFPTTINIFSNKMTYFNNKNILEHNKCYKLLSSVHYFFLTSKIELY